MGWGVGRESRVEAVALVQVGGEERMSWSQAVRTEGSEWIQETSRLSVFP